MHQSSISHYNISLLKISAAWGVHSASPKPFVELNGMCLSVLANVSTVAGDDRGLGTPLIKSRLVVRLVQKHYEIYLNGVG